MLFRSRHIFHRKKWFLHHKLHKQKWWNIYKNPNLQYSFWVLTKLEFVCLSLLNCIRHIKHRAANYQLVIPKLNFITRKQLEVENYKHFNHLNSAFITKQGGPWGSWYVQWYWITQINCRNSWKELNLPHYLKNNGCMEHRTNRTRIWKGPMLCISFSGWVHQQEAYRGIQMPRMLCKDSIARESNLKLNLWR